MRLLLTRYFWAIRLAGIAILALVVATGLNDWVAGRLFAVPTPDAFEPGDDVVVDAQSWGRVAPDEDAARILSARHVFDLDPEPDAPPAPPPKPDPPAPPAAPSGELEETALAIDLVGTLVGEEAETSVATLEVAGKSRLAFPGSRLLDGQATVVSIAPRHVVLEERGGERTVVKLWDADSHAIAQRGRPNPRTRPGMHTPAARSLDDRVARAQRLRRAVHRNGAYRYTVDRAGIAEELRDTAAVRREARAIPAYDQGALHGIKLVGVRPGSLYRALGLRSGDVLTAIDGRSITNASAALSFVDGLRSASRMALRIERRGREKTLQYTIR